MESERRSTDPIAVTVELRISYPTKGLGSQMTKSKADVVSALCAQVNTLLPLSDWTECLVDMESLLLKVTPEGECCYRIVFTKEHLTGKKG